ncbi:LamG domain-containing protein [Verrucomicrobiaceae bacterium 227]
MKPKHISTHVLSVAIAFLGASFSNAELADGLVEYWDFDGDYAAALDASNDGILAVTGTGSASFVEGKFGSAVDLENSTDNQAVINVGDPAEFAFEGASMTVSAWYTTESLYTGWNTLISQGEGGNWRIARHGTSETDFKYSIVGPASVPAKIDQQDGSWHHVAVTHDSLGDITMYIDGVAAGTVGTWALGNGSGLALQIGGNPQAANRGWDGNIDDVALWDRALSPEEVSLIWNDGNGASIESLVDSGAPLQIVGVTHTRTEDNTLVDLTFTSKEGSIYSVFATNNLAQPLEDWIELENAIPAAAEASSTVFSIDFNARGVSLDDHQFFVVVKNP